jgi:hypothetical protein
LPVIGRDLHPRNGLGFEFLEDGPAMVDDELGTYRRVITGHSYGMITINLAEADPASRERMREQMNEPCRTLLGHFRHESGHDYWRRLITRGTRLNTFRRLFGDERIDYNESLTAYYRDGPEPDWTQRCVSAYASAHPWEVWAETWAHYLHMSDTLETAFSYGLIRMQQAVVITVLTLTEITTQRKAGPCKPLQQVCYCGPALTSDQARSMAQHDNPLERVQDNRLAR